MRHLMRKSASSFLLSIVILTVFTNNDSFNIRFVAAANVRRGSSKPNEEISDMSVSEMTRSLSSLTDAAAFALKKTPPVFKSSKCGQSMFRKMHPLCFRGKDETEAPSKGPSIPLSDNLNGNAPALSPPPVTVSPAPTWTHAPTERPLNCVLTIYGSALIIPSNQRLRQGDVFCLHFGIDPEDQVYFGLTWNNQFGLFRAGDGEPIWRIPDEIAANVDRWTLQNDGNLVLQNKNNQSIWNSQSHGNRGSRMVMKQESVWIESESGLELWSPRITSAPTSLVTDQPSTSPPTLEPSTSPPTLEPSTSTPTTPAPSQSPSTPFPSTAPSTPFPSSAATRMQDRPLNCVQTIVGTELTIPDSQRYRQGDVHCLILPTVEEEGGDNVQLSETTIVQQQLQQVYFGYTWTNQFGLFWTNGTFTEEIWTIPDAIVANFDRWSFQTDGNLVLRNKRNNSIWNSQSRDNGRTSRLKISKKRVWIETNSGTELFSKPSFIPPPQPVYDGSYPDPNGALQYYAYYYPWYIRGDWSRHGYQDEPLLGKYGTDEVEVAEQHIEWALQTGITSWIVSWWGPNSLSMRHFKNGMLQAPSLHKIKFCMLYETPILDDRGNWYDGSLENALYDDLKVIRDEFLDHPSYLHINGRPVIIFYITRSRMDFQLGFDGPSVLANMRRRLGVDIYFIADEPFFNWFNESPEGNGNAFKDGTQVFDAYTTYNMYANSRVRDGETATSYQLREAMPVWQEWSNQLPFFPNVMPQYYDFRGHKPLLGNAADFRMQLREVACLPRTNFNGAPHIMFITSFNEWWEGTQIEPENGSSDNWSNYGFEFMQTLAEFKREVDSVGTYWCDEVQAELSINDEE